MGGQLDNSEKTLIHRSTSGSGGLAGREVEAVGTVAPAGTSWSRSRRGPWGNGAGGALALQGSPNY